MKKPNEPLYSSGDVAEMFGYAHGDSLHVAVHRGTFPKPDVTIPRSSMSGHGCRPRVYWIKQTLEKEKARRAAKTKDE